MKLAVREPARERAANEAVCRLLADVLGVAASRVEVTSGHRSRRKRLTVNGLDLATAARRLVSVPGTAADPELPS